MLANGVKETTATTGTGTVTLTAAAGFVRFAQAFATGRRVSYAIRDGENWEWGIGTVGASNTLARSLITATLASGTYTADGSATALDLSGDAEVICTPQGGDWVGTRAGHLDSGYFPNGAGIQSASLVSTSFTSNTLRYFPCLLTRPMRLTHMSIFVTTAGGTAARLGIYANDEGWCRPGDLILDAGAVATNSTGQKEISISGGLVLQPGLYWLAMVNDGGVTLRVGTLSGSSPRNASTLLTAQYFGWWDFFTYGALPASAGSPMDDSGYFAPVFVRGVFL